jgi:predicted kinase
MAKLHFIAGRAGSGKTSLGRQLAITEPAVVLCEDEWMSKLVDRIDNLEQYLSAARRIRSVIGPLAIDLLRVGTSVVFDFAGNTAQERAWVRSIFETARAEHALHVLDVDEATCRQRIRERNELQPPGVFFGVVTEQQVDEVNRFFEPPRQDERFWLIAHGKSD